MPLRAVPVRQNEQRNPPLPVVGAVGDTNDADEFVVAPEEIPIAHPKGDEVAQHRIGLRQGAGKSRRQPAGRGVRCAADEQAANHGDCHGCKPGDAFPCHVPYTTQIIRNPTAQWAGLVSIRISSVKSGELYRFELPARRHRPADVNRAHPRPPGCPCHRDRTRRSFTPGRTSPPQRVPGQ